MSPTNRHIYFSAKLHMKNKENILLFRNTDLNNFYSDHTLLQTEQGHW